MIGLGPRRRECGLTRSQLAERVGVTPGYLADLETGRRVPSLRVLLCLATELGCACDRLLNEGSAAHPPPPPGARFEGGLIREHMAKRGLTRAQVARATGRNPSTIAHALANRPISLLTLTDIAQALEVGIDDLVGVS